MAHAVWPIARLVRSVDFERVLRTRSRMSTAHFALHHVAGVAPMPTRPVRSSVLTELSTGDAHARTAPVDDSVSPCSPRAVADGREAAIWLGAVVPKRHARRAVTRTLLKRQISAAAERHGDRLPSGLWVVRLRAPFDRKVFVSASSSALRDSARQELDDAFAAVLATAPCETVSSGLGTA